MPDVQIATVSDIFFIVEMDRETIINGEFGPAFGFRDYPGIIPRYFDI